MRDVSFGLLFHYFDPELSKKQFFYWNVFQMYFLAQKIFIFSCCVKTTPEIVHFLYVLLTNGTIFISILC